MNNKELFYFTGKCLNPGTNADLGKSASRGMDWEELIWKWDKMMILPTICHQLEKHDLLHLIPKELSGHLQEIFRLNRERNRSILRQVDKITSALNREGIFPVYLKGTAFLLEGLYRDPGERIIGDIDLLVPEKEFLPAAGILETMGYRSYWKIYDDVRNEMHYPALTHEEEPADVEIHRIPVTVRHPGRFTAENIITDKKPVAGKPGCYVPGDLHKVIHTFLHGQVMNHGHAWKQISFRGLYDLLLMSERVNVAEIAGKTGYSKKAISWLVLAGRILDCPVKFYPDEPFFARWYCARYDFSLSFPLVYRIWTGIRKALFIVMVRYAGKLLKAIFYRSGRKAIIRRLKDRDWYINHLKSLIH